MVQNKYCIHIVPTYNKYKYRFKKIINTKINVFIGNVFLNKSFSICLNLNKLYICIVALFIKIDRKIVNQWAGNKTSLRNVNTWNR